MDPLFSGPWVGSLLLAATGEPILPTTPGLASDILRQVGAGLVLLLLLMLWARFLRRKKRKRKRRHHQHRRPLRHEVEPAGTTPPSEKTMTTPASQTSGTPPTDAGDKPESETEGDGSEPHSRRRRHRKDHRPRNPTLAETGGLPPRRDDAQPPSAV